MLRAIVDARDEDDDEEEHRADDLNDAIAGSTHVGKENEENAGEEVIGKTADQSAVDSASRTAGDRHAPEDDGNENAHTNTARGSRGNVMTIDNRHRRANPNAQTGESKGGDAKQADA